MTDQEKQLARAAMTAQKVNLVQNLGGIAGFALFGGLWLWLMYEPMEGNPLVWFVVGIVLALVGLYVGSRTALSLFAR